MEKKALITGLTGQDGSYLAELLLENGYRVYGLIPRSSVEREGSLRASGTRFIVPFPDVRIV